MRLTVRGRLTAVYGGLFVLAGLVLLGVIYVLVERDTPQKFVGTASPPPKATAGVPDTGQAHFEQVVEGTRAGTLHTLLTQGVIALFVVSAATIALGWLIAGRMLQPLHQVTAAARRIAEAPAADRGLHERIALDGPNDELKQLADTFDLMLARLDQSLDSQRRFIANASHELRTPLTLNRTLIEVALEPDGTSPEVRQLGTTLLAINDRHGRLIDGLLLLARSDREVTERSYVDLADIVDHVAVSDTVKVVAEPDEAAVLGDPILLERLVQNLVENGARHNVPTGGWVRVTTRTLPDGWVELQVSNSGPMVPRYEVAGLFEPFRRFNRDRLASPGAGLGLSIVRAVVGAHHGRLRADAREEGGLTITVLLPKAP
ncbi:sensor protein CutS [Actinoplanes italicus]|uniref:histidine kinase n=1 Tax=Actinoplanes italicus TaxID=113567 RepID=A0A2T0KNR2_9ACTN|nr:HAMP domain-containing sensor histidine kinase [Actinoplanes italicus]PRX25369.1 signal transduction histidine kinase [Actinoplanes italicus]GIE29191.1 sensor protein CutS [Actinoplanes italicus]